MENEELIRVRGAIAESEARILQAVRQIVTDAVADSEARILARMTVSIDATGKAFVQALNEVYVELGSIRARMAMNRCDDRVRLNLLDNRVDNLESK